MKKSVKSTVKRKSAKASAPASKMSHGCSEPLALASGSAQSSEWYITLENRTNKTQETKVSPYGDRLDVISSITEKMIRKALKEGLNQSSEFYFGIQRGQRPKLPVYETLYPVSS